jgi:hypothetical protein
VSRSSHTVVEDAQTCGQGVSLLLEVEQVASLTDQARIGFHAAA